MQNRMIAFGQVGEVSGRVEGVAASVEVEKAGGRDGERCGDADGLTDGPQWASGMTWQNLSEQVITSACSTFSSSTNIDHSTCINNLPAMVKTTADHPCLTSSMATDDETLPITPGDLNNHLVSVSPDDHPPAVAEQTPLLLLALMLACQP